MGQLNRRTQMVKLVNRSYFVRLLISFLALTTLTLLLSSVVIYRNYEIEAIKDSSATSEQMLSKTVYNADLIWDWASKHAFELYCNNYIFNAIYGHDISPLDEYNAQKIMSYAMNSNPFIYSIYLYNGYMGKVFSSVSHGYVKDEFFDQNIFQILEDKSTYEQFCFIPRIMRYEHYGKKYNADILSLIVTESASDSTPVNGALVLNIKVSAIQDMIRSMNRVDNEDDFFVIVDRNGKVVSHSQPGMFLKNLSEEEYMSQVNSSSNKNSGYFTETINGEKYLITYVKSDKLEWSFIRANKYEKLFTKTYGLRNIIIVYSVLLFVLIASFSVWLSWRFYSPIDGLVKLVKKEVGDIVKLNSDKGITEFEFISRAYNKIIESTKLLKQLHRDNKGLLRRELLKDLLTGGFSYYSNIGKKFEELDIKLELNDFMIVVFRIDNYWNGFRRINGKEDASMMRFAISNMANEIISSLYKNETVDMGEDQVVVILNTCNEDTYSLQGSLEQLIRKLQKASKEHLGIGLSGAIGYKVKTFAELPEAYKFVLGISDYRLVFGKECIIFPEMVQDNIIREYIYQEETEKKIMDNLKLRNYTGVEEIIGKFFETLKSCSYTDIMMSISRLVYASIKTISSISGKSNYEYNFKTLRNGLEHLDTLDEIKSWMLEILKKEIDKMGDNVQNRKNDHVEKVIKYINVEFANPNLSTEELASRLGLTSNYLREIFKELKGISISNYINEYRCEKAKELLLQTDMTVAEISEKVGIINQNYFFTLFKKYSGMTPMQLRKEKQRIYM